MKKKLVSLVLASAMVLSLVACGKETPADGETAPAATGDQAETQPTEPATDGGDAVSGDSQAIAVHERCGPELPDAQPNE